jgi:hypothetical protein
MQDRNQTLAQAAIGDSAGSSCGRITAELEVPFSNYSNGSGAEEFFEI